MRHLLSAGAVTAVETAGTADADGWLRARVPIESADRALADFLRLGADIEIVEPASLREQAARTIQAMAAIYNQPESSHAGKRQMAGRDCVRHGTVRRAVRGGQAARTLMLLSRTTSKTSVFLRQSGWREAGCMSA
jgi:hypothetical protein